MGRALSLLAMVAVTFGVAALAGLRTASRSSRRPASPLPPAPRRRCLLLTGPAYHLSLSVN